MGIEDKNIMIETTTKLIYKSLRKNLKDTQITLINRKHSQNNMTPNNSLIVITPRNNHHLLI